MEQIFQTRSLLSALVINISLLCVQNIINFFNFFFFFFTANKRKKPFGFGYNACYITSPHVLSFNKLIILAILSAIIYLELQCFFCFFYVSGTSGCSDSQFCSCTMQISNENKLLERNYILT